MADVIHKNYLLLPVINRFGIQLGFGDKTIEEVCVANKVNVNFFLEIINTFHDRNYFPEHHFQSISMTEIIDYLKKSHDFFVKIKLSLIEKYIENLVEGSLPENKEKFLLVRNFYKDYKTELFEHISSEDKIIYPYVIEIENIYNSKTITENQKENIKKYSIKKYEKEHDDVEEKLFDLKNLIIKYLPPANDNNLCNSILFEIFELENDLNDHQRIEDKILIPKVIAMEEFIKEKLF